jgi:geranylgeranyl reductase family protein
MENWDVVVAGGGPSGISTALHLVQRNPAWAGRVLVIEKARYPRPKLCGGGITDYGFQAIKALGLDLAEIPHTKADEVRLTYRGQRLSFWKRPVLHVVRRDVFDAWLAQKAMERGVTVHQGEAVADVQPHDGGVSVRTSEGAYEARTLVVADGSKGVIRRKLDMEDTGHVARLIEIITPAEDENSRALHREAVAVFDFTPRLDGLQGYYWDFPCVVDGRPSINRGVYDARAVPELPKADLKGVLRESLAERGLDIDQVELMGHPIHWFDPQAALARPHVLLVGDAAGADPLLGEGIAFALGYGEVAAAEIDDAFARNDFAYAGYHPRLMAGSWGSGLKLRVDLARLLYRYNNAFAHWLIMTTLRATMQIVPGMRMYRRPVGA